MGIKIMQVILGTYVDIRVIQVSIKIVGGCQCNARKVYNIWWILGRRRKGFKT